MPKPTYGCCSNVPENNSDGNLLFMMGRCREEGKNDLDAKDWYEKAIKADGPRKIEAYQRLATLLHQPDRLNDPTAADQIIDEMVQSSPDNYQVYLVRGRYRRQYGLPNARDDIAKVLKLAGDKPEIVLLDGRGRGDRSGPDEARKILEAGLAEVQPQYSTALINRWPTSNLCRAHRQGCRDPGAGSEVSRRSGRPPDNARQLPVPRGDTGKLLLQIEELKKLGCNPKILQFLKGYYHVNASQFREARQVLAPLEPLPGWPAQIKTRISTLLARCYGQLGEPELQQEAYLRDQHQPPGCSGQDRFDRPPAQAGASRRGDQGLPWRWSSECRKPVFRWRSY